MDRNTSLGDFRRHEVSVSDVFHNSISVEKMKTDNIPIKKMVECFRTSKLKCGKRTLNLLNQRFNKNKRDLETVERCLRTSKACSALE